MSQSVRPEKLASKTLTGLRTKRGPISARDPSSSTIWKFRNQTLSSTTEKVYTWSKKGWLFGWWLGTEKIWVKSSLSSLRWASFSKLWSNVRSGLDPLRQLPVIFNSAMVCTFSTWNFALGPLATLEAHR